MKQRIIAWGSDKFPDLDMEIDGDIPRDLCWKYPFVEVQLLEVVSASALRDALAKHQM